MIRRLAATFAALAMLLVLAVPVMAGGWAEIVADGQTVTPKEGSSTEVGFKVCIDAPVWRQDAGIQHQKGRLGLRLEEATHE